MTTLETRPAPAPLWAGDWAAVWDAVLRGEEPAESLPSSLRAALFRTLRAEGWTDTEVGAWTRTTVTVIRRQIGRWDVDTDKRSATRPHPSPPPTT